VIAPVIVPGWTLNYEAFFYVIFALTLLLPAGRRSTVLTAVMGGLCLVGLALPHGQWALADTYTDPLILEFAAGVWLAKAAAAGRLGRTRAAIVAIAAGVLVMTVAAVTGVDVRGWARLLFWGFPALLIVWGALSLEGSGRVPVMPLLKGLGDASYSLYLAHGLALSLAFKLIGGRGLPAWAEVMLAVPLALVCGALCYRLAERPLLTLFHGRKGRLTAARARVVGWSFLRAKAQS